MEGQKQVIAKQRSDIVIAAISGLLLCLLALLFFTPPARADLRDLPPDCSDCHEGNDYTQPHTFDAAEVVHGTSYSGYVQTDNCVQCHDVHEAEGDYALTREATVTAVCATCHGLFGAAAPPGVTWSSTPPDFDGTSPVGSVLLAYEINMSSMTPEQMDAVPGHSLGIMYDGSVVRDSATIPGSNAILKVITSGQYGGPSEGLYNGEPVTTFEATKGLYCASCHTPHGHAGQWYGQYDPGTGQWTERMMLSSKPNHSATEVTNDAAWCMACHDRRSSSDPNINNHPDQYCLTCHAGPDFPHTGTSKLLSLEPDALCNSCHPSSSLP